MSGLEMDRICSYSPAGSLCASSTISSCQSATTHRENLWAQAKASMPASSNHFTYYSLLRFFVQKLATTSGSLQLCHEINIISQL